MIKVALIKQVFSVLFYLFIAIVFIFFLCIMLTYNIFTYFVIVLIRLATRQRSQWHNSITFYLSYDRFTRICVAPGGGIGSISAPAAKSRCSSRHAGLPFNLNGTPMHLSLQHVCECGTRREIVWSKRQYKFLAAAHLNRSMHFFFCGIAGTANAGPHKT